MVVKSGPLDHRVMLLVVLPPRVRATSACGAAEHRDGAYPSGGTCWYRLFFVISQSFLSTILASHVSLHE